MILKGKVMQIVKIVFLVLLITVSYAKDAKWQKLNSLYDYSESTYSLKEGVEYLELREYTRVKNSKEKMRYTDTAFIVSKRPLGDFPPSKVKKFSKLRPILSDQTDIRKFTSCASRSCVEHIGNGFMIASDGKLWKMNEIADVWNYIEKINTPAKIQLALWLNGKHYGTRYREVSNGYEVIIEEYRSSCGEDEEYEEYFTYSVHVDHQGKVMKEKVLKHSKEKVQCLRKPAIYLYPLSKQKIDVSLVINGDITVSIPPYSKGWSVMVDTNGTIENRYDYLFYENTLKIVELPNEGWIKQGSVLDAWFDVILPKLGLNAKETEQFKEYWLGELDKDALYEIKRFSLPFLTENMTLTIDPKPDTLIRVIFNFKMITEPYELKEPKIITPKRSGFHVLEWGGMIEGER